MNHKSEAHYAFRLFLNFVQTRFHTKIKALESNYQGEFRHFTKYLTELDISHRITYPHTYHKNGTVERKHMHIVEMSLTLLSHISMPLQFWEHNFATSVHFINKLPSTGLPKFQSPYHALYHRLPKIICNHLSQRAYALLREGTRHCKWFWYNGVLSRTLH